MPSNWSRALVTARSHCYLQLVTRSRHRTLSLLALRSREAHRTSSVRSHCRSIRSRLWRYSVASPPESAPRWTRSRRTCTAPFPGTPPLARAAPGARSCGRCSRRTRCATPRSATARRSAMWRTLPGRGLDTHPLDACPARRSTTWRRCCSWRCGWRRRMPSGCSPSTASASSPTFTCAT